MLPSRLSCLRGHRSFAGRTFTFFWWGHTLTGRSFARLALALSSWCLSFARLALTFFFRTFLFCLFTLFI